jgi:hypothetical protein
MSTEVTLTDCHLEVAKPQPGALLARQTRRFWTIDWIAWTAWTAWIAWIGIRGGTRE